MYKLLLSLFSLLSISNGQTSSTMTPITYTCGNAEQSANNNIEVFLAIDYDTDMVYITLTGPSDQYFGIGFGSTTMSNTYAIIVDGDGDVSERTLANRASGSSLTSSTTTLSNTVSGDIRTVLLSREREVTGDYFDFGTYDSTSSLNIIWATDDTNSISSHTGSNRGNNDPIDNFAESNGDSDSCGALGSTAFDDDDSAVSFGIKTVFAVVLASLAFLV